MCHRHCDLPSAGRTVCTWITPVNCCGHPLLHQEMARSRPIDSKGRKGFKVLVLNEVDRLTKEAQHSLRRTMEKYSAACRLVLCCNNASRVRPVARVQPCTGTSSGSGRDTSSDCSPTEAAVLCFMHASSAMSLVTGQCNPASDLKLLARINCAGHRACPQQMPLCEGGGAHNA